MDPIAHGKWLMKEREIEYPFVATVPLADVRAGKYPRPQCITWCPHVSAVDGEGNRTYMFQSHEDLVKFLRWGLE